MKLLKLYVTFGLIISFLPVYAQVFSQITDANNPINTVTIRGFYRGCAFVDMDNDGDLDLSMTNWAFRNEGQDSFSIIPTFGSGPLGGVPDILGGVSWADHDNDGDVDCLYSGSKNNGITWSGGTFIYDNDGTGDFSIKLIESDSSNTLRAWSASWGDFNNDGYVDATGSVAAGFGGMNTPAYLYRGSAEGSFTEMDTFPFAQVTAPYTVAYWTDYDQDGDSDLLWATGPGGAPGFDVHYRNLLKETGIASLERITDEPFATDLQDGQCYNMIDHDLDGDLDMYLTNYGGAQNRFYENVDGSLTSISNDLVFGGPLLGNCWGDFDNDGDQDLLLTSDAIGSAGYYQNENGVFTKLGNPFQEEFIGGNISGLTIGDYNNDGALDFFANGGVGGQNGPRGLYRNTLDNGNHWVIFDLEGVLPSNRSALGAQVRVKANIAGEDRWLYREVSAQNTFMGHNSLRVHFGVAGNTVIDSVQINWPSGNIDAYINLPADTIYQITEGDIINGLFDFEQDYYQPLKIIPNPAKNYCLIEKPEGADQAQGLLVVSNSVGQQVFTSKETNKVIELDLTDWPAGIYYTVWNTIRGNYLAKIIVQ